MNILHLDLGKELRGGQHQVLLLMSALARRGHRQLLVGRAGSPLLDAAKQRGLPAQSLGRRLPAGYDIIHAHDARAHTRALTSRLPLVVSRRVAFPVKRGVLSRLKYRRAAHFIAVSEFVAVELRRTGVPPEKIIVIFDGVELPATVPHHSGRFIAGAIDAPPEKPMHLFAGLGVILNPARLPAALAEIDALVYLSKSEGLGSGILMAMAYGLPVVASNTGGIPEIVADGKTGYLVENTAAAVKHALAQLTADPARARAMGAAGRTWVAGHATDAIMAERTEAVYRLVLGSKT
jgi:glycosyltransferase involved in cell wall biosynthesis